MTYVPVYCDACARGSLAPAKPDEETLPCSFCEGPTRPIPGPAFGDGDWLTFAEIDAAVFEAELDRARALSLTAELEASLDRGDSFSQMVNQVLEKEPSLRQARRALVSPPDRGFRMLMTVLTGRVRHVSSAASSLSR